MPASSALPEDESDEVLPGMKEGDIICELYGGDLLHVLRYEEGGEVAKLIGIAYVHGLMNGEALTAPDR